MALKQVNVVGFSDGAITALLLAMNHPGAVAKMALLGVNLKPDDFTEESYRFVRETYEQTKDPPYKLMLEQPQIALGDVKDIHVPTLLVAAEDDVFRPQTFTDLAAALPNGRLKVMEGHDHNSYIAGQDLLYPDLMEFFG